MNKFQKFIAKVLFGKDCVNHLEPIGNVISYADINEKLKKCDMLYDFIKTYNGGIFLNGNSVSVNTLTDMATPAMDEPASNENRPVVRNLDPVNPVTLSPKMLYAELERVPNPVELDEESIKKRISLIERKLKLKLDNTYTEAEMKGMKECLERRFRYNEFKDFFEQYAYTKQEKIDAFLKKYDHLTMKETKLFIPTFPDDAITVMEEYTEKVQELSGKTPVFYVIAKKEDFKEKDRKNDPILLVQSPFGFYWQILGAWDDEMLLLDEL